MNLYNNTKKLNIEIPKEAEMIINRLNGAGYEAFVVGGCVRDVILDKIPEDWDITTSAKPEQVKELFPVTIDTGIKHGTVTVLLNHTGYEVTTYRIDGEYLDSRHPETVEFTSNLIEDLKRRDFTINAMAYSPALGLVDAFEGMKDLKRGRIRCVGIPEERFEEDALRILRAVRFSAQLGFEIDDTTKEAIGKLAPNLTNISKERIQIELDKLLISNEPEKIKVCYETGISTYILDWLDEMFKTGQNTKYHAYNVGDHTIEVLKHTPADHYLRWAALLHDVGKPAAKSTDRNGVDHFYKHAMIGSRQAKKILKDLRFDNKTIDIVTRLVFYHDYHVSMTLKGVRKSIYKIGEDIYPMFIKLRMADLQGKSEIGLKTGMKELEFIKKAYGEIMESNDCLSLKDLAVTGKDLIEAGVQPGKEIGMMLDDLLQIVLEDPEKNEKAYLMGRIHKN